MNLLVKHSFLVFLLLFNINLSLGQNLQSEQKDNEELVKEADSVVTQKPKQLASASMNRGPLKMAPENAMTRNSQNVNLFYSSECEQEVKDHCRSAVEMTDAAVLKCIHNNVKSLKMITKECQHVTKITKTFSTVA